MEKTTRTEPGLFVTAIAQVAVAILAVAFGSMAIIVLKLAYRYVLWLWQLV